MGTARLGVVAAPRLAGSRKAPECFGVGIQASLGARGGHGGPLLAAVGGIRKRRRRRGLRKRTRNRGKPRGKPPETRIQQQQQEEEPRGEAPGGSSWLFAIRGRSGAIGIR